jgi:hypothetical protein
MTRAEWLNLARARAEALALAESAVAAGVLPCSESMHGAMAQLAWEAAWDLDVAAAA